MRRLWGVLAAALVLTLMVAGCGGSKKQESTPAGGTQTTTQPSTQTKQPSTQPAQTTTQPSAGAAYAIVAQESTASYSVREKFANQELPVTAVGKTSGFKGELVIANGLFAPSTVTVDLSQLKSDQSRRDNALKTKGLETDKYPTAELKITGTQGGAPALAEGKEVGFKLAGTLKVHGVEKNVVWDAKATLQGDTVKLAAQLKFNMKDYDISPPSVLGTLTVDENVQLDVQVTAKKS